MNVFRSIAAVLLLAVGLASVPAHAGYNGDDSSGSEDPAYSADAPKAWAMAADLAIARPALLVGTVIGAGLFVLTLPITIAGGNVKEAGKAFVLEPGEATFIRCLGCTNSGYSHKDDRGED